MSITAAQGFQAGGLAAGIKPSGASDLSIVATSDSTAVAAAGVFTTNLVQAAPVQISRKHLENRQAAAVVLNSGNANAATGKAGRIDAMRMCELTAQALGCNKTDVLVCSTGLIGIPMPMEAIETGIPKLGAQLGSDRDAAVAAADAILTTDTRRKEAQEDFLLSSGTQVTLGGMAKGAAMLAPAMATMLTVITTDAAIDPDLLQVALADSVMDSFDMLNIDGATSTNDTVIVLANGASNSEPINNAKSTDFAVFQTALHSVCASLASQMAHDAEGATKYASITVQHARSMTEARMAARAVAGSQLVQCSLYGGDPYWGRIIGELGASGAFFDPEQVSISYNGILVCENGIAVEDVDEALLKKSMDGIEIEIVANLRAGHGTATSITTDLSPAYIDENMRTS